MVGCEYRVVGNCFIFLQIQKRFYSSGGLLGVGDGIHNFLAAYLKTSADTLAAQLELNFKKLFGND